MIKDIEETLHIVKNTGYDATDEDYIKATEYLLSLVKKQRKALEDIVNRGYTGASYVALEALKEE